MTMLLNELGIHATVFAFGMNDENLHAPNEFFRLSNFRIGQTSCWSGWSGWQRDRKKTRGACFPGEVAARNSDRLSSHTVEQ